MNAITLRQETSRDMDSIDQLLRAAFPTSAEAELVTALRESRNLLLSLVAVEDENIIGHIAISPMSMDGQGERTLVGLGPMAVLPSKQNQGVGSKLMLEAEKELMKMNCDAIFVLGHKNFYPKFGFLPSLATYSIHSTYTEYEDHFFAKPISAEGLHELKGEVRYAAPFNNL